jgi:hypothetical protein
MIDEDIMCRVGYAAGKTQCVKSQTSKIAKIVGGRRGEKKAAAQGE